MTTGNPTLAMPSTNPYVGPRRFEQEESKFFFGRDEEIKILSGLVVAHQLSLFYAQSGAGKSSLLRAGLLPRLTRKSRVGSGDNAYLYQTMQALPIVTVGRGVPPSTSEPIRNIFSFSAQLTLLPSADPNDLAVLTLVDALDILLDDGIQAGAIWEPVQERNGRVRPPLRKPDKTLLIFDQFEELFTVYPERWREREAFFHQIDDALRQFPTLHILFTMREDYLAELTPFAHLLTDDLRHRFRMERLRKAGALLAVTQPALAAEPSRTFAPGVAEELVNNLRRMQRSQRSQRLPQAPPASAATTAAPTATEGEYIEPVHLQIVCRDLWSRLPAERTEIQTGDLRSLGDVDQALTNFYENTLARVVAETGSSERTLRHWFTEELITPARTKALVYRDDERQETAGLPNAAVDLLQNAWLIRSDMRGGDVWYELAHDRLVEPILAANLHWETTYDNPVAAAFARWKLDKSPERFLRDHLLNRAEAYANHHPNEITDDEKQYLIDSRRQWNDGQTEAQRATRRRYAVLIAGALVIAVLAALTIYAFGQAEKALKAETEAIIREADTRAGKLATQSQTALSSGHYTESLLLAVEAISVTLAYSDAIGTAAQQALYDSLRVVITKPEYHGVHDLPLLLGEHDAAVNSVTFSPDGQWIATGSDDRTVRLWKINQHNTPPTILNAHNLKVNAVVFAPDSQWLATSSADSTIQLWLLSQLDGASIVLRGHEASVNALAFSHDGQWLATASDDQTIRLWHVDQPNDEPIVLPKQDASIRTVAFSPNGEWLATSGDDRRIQLWLVADFGESTISSRQVGSHEATVKTLTFSPDSQWLATGSYDHTVRLWPINHENPDPIVLRSHDSWISHLSFSADGKWLATSSLDATARLWRISPSSIDSIVLRGYERGVNAIAFSLDGEWLATGAFDNKVHLWQRDLVWLKERACQLAERNMNWAEWERYFGQLEYRPTCSGLVIPTDVAAARWKKGEEQAQRGEIESAITHFKRALRLNPLLSLDPEKEARSIYDATQAKQLVEDGHALARQNQLPAAVAKFEAAIVLDPTLATVLSPPLHVATQDAVRALIEVGTKLARNQEITVAVAQFEAALVLSPTLTFDDPLMVATQLATETLLADGRKLARNQDLPGAIAKFAQIVALDPNAAIDPETEARTHAATALVEQGRSLAQTQKIDDAAATFSEALALDPSLTIEPRAEAQRLAEEANIEDTISDTAQIDESLLLIGATRVHNEFKITGRGLTVAVIDTGINTEHVDFTGRLIAQVNFTTDNHGDPQAVSDGNGHGTTISGIIAANGEHLGVAPNAKIVAIKVLGNSGGGNFEWIDQALQWVIDNRAQYNISVVCMSLGDSGNYTIELGERSQFFSTLFQTRLTDRIRTLRNDNVAVVTPAGNDYFTHDSQQGMSFPAILRESISVGAVYDAALGSFTYGSGTKAISTVADQIAPFSQRLHKSVAPDTYTDIFAPGAALTSSGSNGPTGESTHHGTAQAAAVTAGVLLLLQEYHVRQTGKLPSVDDLATWLRDGGVTIYDGDDEDDNVQHTNLDFIRVDAFSTIKLMQTRLSNR